MVFIVKVNKINEDVLNFFQDSHNRIQIGNPYLNSYKGYIKRIKETNYFIVSMKIIFPKFWIFGLMYILAFLLLNNFNLNFWILPGVILFLPIILWSDIFTYLMLLIGLKKHTKNIRCSKLLNKEALEIVGIML